MRKVFVVRNLCVFVQLRESLLLCVCVHVGIGTRGPSAGVQASLRLFFGLHAERMILKRHYPFISNSKMHVIRDERR